MQAHSKIRYLTSIPGGVSDHLYWWDKGSVRDMKSSKEKVGMPSGADQRKAYLLVQGEWVLVQSSFPETASLTRLKGWG